MFAESSSTQQRQSLVTKSISTNMTQPRIYHGWKYVQVDVNSTTPYSINFEATNQEPATSFAIDSIVLANSTCAGLTNVQPGHSMLDRKLCFFFFFSFVNKDMNL